MLLVRHEAHQKDKLLVDSFISDMELRLFHLGDKACKSLAR